MTFLGKWFGKTAPAREPARESGGRVFLHIKTDGTVLALQEAPDGLKWLHVTVDRLEKELEVAKAQGAAVIYSRDDPDHDPSKEVLLIFKIIMGHGLPIQLRRDPPIAVPT